MSIASRTPPIIDPCNFFSRTKAMAGNSILVVGLATPTTVAVPPLARTANASSIVSLRPIASNA